MNETFNIKRFGKYLLTDIRIFMSRNLLVIIVFCLTYLLLYIPWDLLILTFTHTWEGVQVGFRTFLFLICTSVLTIAVPIRAYGKVTDRKKGSEWILTPVSVFEKTVSMLLITVSTLLITVAAYLGMDALICLIDPTCGETIVHSLINMGTDFQDSFIGSMLIAETNVIDFIGQIVNPFLYIDNLVALILTFLLGGILFKRGKAPKTMLCLMLYGFIAGIIVSITMGIMGYNGFNEEMATNDFFNHFIFKHITLITTAIDLTIISLLTLCIYSRVKNLKH